tara:strand:+ start:4388 stop:5407 length:1020 start_codon:yes stop_codon:yes gene_type:complete
MQITKEELVGIIKDEIENMKREVSGEISSCLLGHMDIDAKVDDRLRPEHEPMMSDTIEEKGGSSKPRKTMAQKAKTKARYDDRIKRERFRKKVLGGETTMQTLGISEEELDEKKEKPKTKTRRGNRHKPSKKRQQCTVGNAFHSKSTGKFVNPSDEKGSWSLSGKGGKTTDCSKGQYRRKGANKATTFTKTPCGREGRKKGTGVKCSTGKIEENWKNFLNEARKEDERYRLEGGSKVSGDSLRSAVKREMQKLLTNYEKWVGENQHKVIQNSRGLDDAKLSTYCDAFGFTSFRDYLQRTNALNTIANNVVAMKDGEHGGQVSQKPQQSSVPQQSTYNQS